MTIVLLNGFGLTSNVGDHALLTSTVSVLMSQFPLASIHVIPWQQTTAEMAKHFKQQLPAFSEAELGQSILPAYSAGKGFPDASPFERAKILIWTAHVNMQAELGGRLRFLTSARSPLRLISEASLVVLRGCNIVQRGSDVRSLAGIRRITFPLWAARRAGRRTALLNISVGPIEHPFARRMVRKAIEGADFVSTRESSTQEYLTELACRRAVASADTAFAFPERSDSYPGRDRNLIGLNVLSKGEYLAATQGSVEMYYGLLTKLAAELNHLTTVFPEVRILGIPHEIDSSLLNSDVHPLQWVLSKLAQRGCFEVMDQARSVTEVVGLYRRVSLAIGMRFHGYVLASLAGTPVLGIDIKSRKTTGVARSLSLEDWMIDLGRPGHLTEVVQAAYPRSAVLQHSVTTRASQLRGVVVDTFATYAQSSGLQACAATNG